MLGLLTVVSTSASALTLNIDYTYDSNGFFNDTARRDALVSAAAFFEPILTDNLTGITSSGVNHFNAKFSNPGTGSITTINDFSVATDTITVFAGGRALAGSTIGQGGFGGYNASGTSTFFNTFSRGQGSTQGSTATDFASWGGSITFDTSTSWYFDSNTATTEAFTGNDFYSVALHELGHLLGLGTADSWNNLISNGAFTGAASTAVNGGNVLLNGTGGHWAAGTSSTVNGVNQEAAMTPSLTTGSRKVFTALDLAGLQDTGWQVAAVPVPAAVWLFGSGLMLMFASTRRRLPAV